MPSLLIRACPQDAIRLDSDFATLALCSIKDHQIQMRFVLLNSPQFVGHLHLPFGQIYYYYSDGATDSERCTHLQGSMDIVPGKSSISSSPECS